jgi:hypothetical protein
VIKPITYELARVAYKIICKKLSVGKRRVLRHTIIKYSVDRVDRTILESI